MNESFDGATPLTWRYTYYQRRCDFKIFISATTILCAAYHVGLYHIFITLPPPTQLYLTPEKTEQRECFLKLFLVFPRREIESPKFRWAAHYADWNPIQTLTFSSVRVFLSERSSTKQNGKQECFPSNSEPFDIFPWYFLRNIGDKQCFRVLNLD